MTEDEKYMARALALAEQGKKNVAPNPMVGCVIAHAGKIIGEGFHAQFGGPHAEVNAIHSVLEEDCHLLADSTLYVTLEPCSHFGKTPPCADLIISAKIPRVVIASRDPNPLVSGRGISRLTNAEVQVTTGVLAKEADFLNRRFFTFQTKLRPYIILKWAESIDGFLAPHEPKQVWLTGETARALVHEWRSEESAIMVGTRTVVVDDPALTVRFAEGKNPVRVVIDRKLTLAPTQKIFHPDAPVIVFNEIETETRENTERIKIDFTGNVLAQILEHAHARSILSVIIEGGAETLAHFVETDLWDEARVFTTPAILKEGKAAPRISGTCIREEMIGEDKLCIYVRT